MLSARMMEDEAFDEAATAEAEAMGGADVEAEAVPVGTAPAPAPAPAGAAAGAAAPAAAEQRKRRDPPAIVYTEARLRALLEMLTCANDEPFFGTAGGEGSADGAGIDAVRKTWGDFRKKPVTGGKAGFYAALYRHWKHVDASVTVPAGHNMVKKHGTEDKAASVSIAAKLQDLKEVRDCRQTLATPPPPHRVLTDALCACMWQKWELATGTPSGTPQTEESKKAEAYFRRATLYDLAHAYWPDTKDRRRRGASEADGTGRQGFGGNAADTVRAPPPHVSHSTQSVPPIQARLLCAGVANVLGDRRAHRVRDRRDRRGASQVGPGRMAGRSARRGMAPRRTTRRRMTSVQSARRWPTRCRSC